MNAKDNALIFMVDDDAEEILLIKRYLQVFKLSFQLKAFTSGKEFLSYLVSVKDGTQPTPMLVLLDLRMPLMDGFEVLDTVRADHAYDHISITIFSNSNDESDIKKSLEKGANAYQVKPFGSDQYRKFFNEISKR